MALKHLFLFFVLIASFFTSGNLLAQDTAVVFLSRFEQGIDACIHGDYTEAFKNFKATCDAQKKAKNNYLYYKSMAMMAYCYGESAEWKEAEKMNQKVLSKLPKVTQGADEIESIVRIVEGRKAEFSKDPAKMFDSYFLAYQLLDTSITRATWANKQVNYLIGKQYVKLNKPFLAAQFFEEALEIEMSQRGTVSPLVAELRLLLGDMYFEIRNLDLARYNYIKYQTVYKELMLDNAEALFHIETRIGDIHQSIGDYTSALTYKLKALSIAKSASNFNRVEKWKCTRDIGIIYDYKKEYELALTYFNKVLAECPTEDPANRDLLSSVYNNLATTYADMNEYSQAISFKTKYLDLLPKTDSFRREHIMGEESLGLLYEGKQEYLTAISFYKKALANWLKEPSVSPVFLAESYESIADAYISVNQYDSAGLYFQSAVNVLKREKNTPSYELRLKTKWAQSYLSNKKYKEALSLLLDMESGVLNVLGASSLEYFDLVQGIAKAYSALSKNNDALIYLRKGLEVVSKNYGTKHPLIAKEYIGIGNQYLLLGDEFHALSCFQHACYSAFPYVSDSLNVHSALKVEHPYSAELGLEALFHKAYALEKVYEKRETPGFLQLAAETYSRVDSLVNYMMHSHYNTQDKDSIISYAERMYKGAMRTYAELAEKEDSEEYRNLSFIFAQRAKSIASQFTFANSILFPASIADSLLEEEASLRIDRSFYEAKFWDLLDERELKRIRTEINLIDQRLDYLKTVMAKKSPAYVKTKYETSFAGIEKLQASLQEGQLFCDFTFDGDFIYRYMITKDNMEMSKLALSSFKDGAKAFSNYSHLLSDLSFREQHPKYDASNLLWMYKESHDLFKKLFTEKASSYSTVFIQTEEPLLLFPFETLVVQDPTQAKVPVFWLQKSLVHQVRKGIPSSQSAEVKNVLLLNPTFMNQEQAIDIQFIKEWEELFNKQQSHHTQVLEGTKVKALDGAEEEGNLVYALAGKASKNCTVLGDSEATEVNLKNALNEQQYDIFHVSGYTRILAGKGASSFSSGLLLMPETDKSSAVFYMDEIAQLPLRSELAVLSRAEFCMDCSDPNVEEFLYSFAFAGTKRVLLSLWDSPKHLLSKQVESLYLQMLAAPQNTQGYLEVLRKTKQALIDVQEYRDPYYWANFQLYSLSN